jgi:hypothetical protein
MFRRALLLGLLRSSFRLSLADRSSLGTPLHSTKPALIISLRALFPNSHRPNIEVDAARLGSRPNASRKALCSSSARRDRKTKAPLALLARADAQGLAYAGSAFVAISNRERDELSARLAMSKLDRSPIPKLRFPDAHWVTPQLMVRVRHLAGTSFLRHATVRAIV